MSVSRASICVVPMRDAADGSFSSSVAMEMRAATLKAGGGMPRQPKPRDPRELEKRFTQVLVSIQVLSILYFISVTWFSFNGLII